MLIFGVIISIFVLPPGQHLGEAEEDEGGEVVGGAAAVEADGKTATPSVVAEGGHVVVASAGLHCVTILIWKSLNPWYCKLSTAHSALYNVGALQ